MKALAIAILLICAIPIYAADFKVEVGTEPMSTTGYGADEHISLDNALANAVDKMLAVYLSADVIARNKGLLEANIIARAPQYVASYNIISIKREGSAIRTFMDTQIKVFPLIMDLMALGIEPKLAPDSDYYRIIAEAKRIAQARQHMYSEWPSLFQPASKMLEFTVDNIYFDEKQAKDGKVPFVLRFYMRPNYEAYDQAARELSYDFGEYKIAEEIEEGGSYFSDLDMNEGTRGVNRPNYPRTGLFQLAIKRGELYVLHNYRVVTPFQEDVKAIMNNNGGLYGDQSKLLFRVQLKSGTGAVLYEDVFPLFPANSKNGKLSIFLRDESGKQIARQVDNEAVSSKSVGYLPAIVYDARPKITPYVYVAADGRLLALDEVFLGYKDSIAIGDVQRITTITVEALQ